jgi:hypothetical protein
MSAIWELEATMDGIWEYGNRSSQQSLEQVQYFLSLLLFYHNCTTQQQQQQQQHESICWLQWLQHDAPAKNLANSIV